MNNNYRQQIIQMLQGMPRAPIKQPGPMPAQRPMPAATTPVPQPPMQQRQPMPPMKKGY